MLAFFAALLPNLSLFADTTATTCTKGSLLLLEPWYYFLPDADFKPGTCDITQFNALGSKSDFLLIGLAILDDLIRIAALVTVGYIIYGGIQYMTSQGSPDATKKAQQTIINALIGLAMALVATAIVTFIGNKLGG